MSLQQLLSDIPLNLADLRRTPITAEGLLSHLENSLYPFLSALVEEVAEMDASLEEMAAGGDDALTPGTAETLTNTLTVAAGVFRMLLQRAPQLTQDPEVIQAVGAADALITQSKQIIEGITLPEGEDEDDDDDDDDDDDGDKEGGEDDDGSPE